MKYFGLALSAPSALAGAVSAAWLPPRGVGQVGHRTGRAQAEQMAQMALNYEAIGTPKGTFLPWFFTAID